MNAAGVPPAPAPPILELRGVSAVAGQRRVVHDVSLAVAPGETLAVVGPSGAGKSTLGRLAVGLIPAAAGSVWFEGRELGALSPGGLRRLRASMQILYQDPHRSLDPCMTVAAIIAEGVELQAAPGTLPRPFWGARRRAWQRQLAVAWLPRIGLDPSLAERLPAQLSGGQRQRVAIARAMALQPRLLVADEPVAALDASAGAQILALLAGLQRQSGVAYLLISHNLAQVAGCAHRIAVMSDGEVVEAGATRQILAAPHHPLTRQLLDALPPWPVQG